MGQEDKKSGQEKVDADGDSLVAQQSKRIERRHPHVRSHQPAHKHRGNSSAGAHPAGKEVINGTPVYDARSINARSAAATTNMQAKQFLRRYTDNFEPPLWICG
ncbi:hypothetical protein FHT76_008413 [Rhizobium sp. BK176]|nr:hypothetical protein [Rhizobium sp. BK176]